ncbi:oligo-1,6-glucosidase, partial [Lacticaseibacillus paracasei subsp. paracasei CNCM I-4649]
KLPARGPMPWTTGLHQGFSNHLPWLVGRSEDATSVAAQQADEASMLHFYQALIALKKQPLFQAGHYRLLTTAPNLYVYERTLASRRALVAVALDEQGSTFTVPEGLTTVALAAGDYQLEGQTLTLGANAGVVLNERGTR